MRRWTRPACFALLLTLVVAINNASAAASSGLSKPPASRTDWHKVQRFYEVVSSEIQEFCASAVSAVVAFWQSDWWEMLKRILGFDHHPPYRVHGGVI